MTLHADVHLERDDFALEASFEVAAGETLALVGPNGAGKSSLLMALAGLLRLAHGRIVLGGRVLDDAAGVFLAPEERELGCLFQDPLLFGHLSVRENVAYGLRSRGRSRAEARRRAEHWLERVGLAPGLHGARPAELSGGQARRAALARALASEPRALLFDEPLAAVDATARIVLRRELREHLATFEGPRIVVVHDITDALALAERIGVLEQGRLVQSGTPRELVGRPRSRYVADLIGVNGYEGRCRDGVVAIGEAELTVASGDAGEVLVTFHPRSVSLYRERPSGSPRNVWPAPVLGVEPLFDRARVRLGGKLPLVAEVTPASVDELRLERGGEVWVAVKATEIQVSAR